MRKILFLGIYLLIQSQVFGQSCDIIWQDMVNTTVTGTTLEKTSGGNGWNADARSTQTIPASTDGYVIYTVSADDYSQQFGLNATNSNRSWSDLDYRLYFQYNPSHSSRKVQATLNGSSTYLTAYNVGDQYRLRRTGDSVFVDKMSNGTSTWIEGLHSGYAYISGVIPELFADVSFFYENASITGATIFCTGSNSYANLANSLDASFYICQGGVFKFKFEEKYYQDGELLIIKFKNTEHQVVYQPLDLLKYTGVNTYSVDLAETGFFTDDTFYTVEVTGTKGRTSYLRILYDE